MPTINERVDQLLTQHDLDLIAFQNGQIRDVVSQINELQGEIVDLLKAAEPRSRRQLEQLLDQVNRAIDRTYVAMAAQSVEAFVGLAATESAAVASITQQAFRAPIAPKLISSEVALEIVETGLVPNDRTGLTVAERWARQRRGLKDNTKDALNYAVQNNQTLDDMLGIIRGNRSLQFRDGVVFKSKAGAETLIRTATDTVINSARLASYQRNANVIRGVQANAVLDNRTTILCRTRNGYAWDLQTGRGFRGTPISFPGTPPWHFNCRTTLAPIFKSLEDLQAVLDPELSEDIAQRGERFPIDGKPAPTPTFAKTFAAMSEAEQKATIGAGRLQLYKDGKITLKDLLDQQGRTLTVRELKEKYGDA